MSGDEYKKHLEGLISEFVVLQESCKDFQKKMAEIGTALLNCDYQLKNSRGEEATITPLWIEAYYFHGENYHPKDSACHRNAKQKTEKWQLYFHRKDRESQNKDSGSRPNRKDGVDICLPVKKKSDIEEIYFSFLIKRCEIDGDRYLQTKECITNGNQPKKSPLSIEGRLSDFSDSETTVSLVEQAGAKSNKNRIKQIVRSGLSSEIDQPWGFYRADCLAPKISISMSWVKPR